MLSVVVGGQFGSEAKGNIAAWLAIRKADQWGMVVGVRVAGPNAGHTVYGPASGAEPPRAWPLRQVPVAAVVNRDAWLVIAAGSEIDCEVLRDEVERLESAGYSIQDRIWIDGAATLMRRRHLEREAGENLTSRVGSTGKGIGAARADRIMRTADTMWNLRHQTGNARDHMVGSADRWVRDRLGYRIVAPGATSNILMDCLQAGSHVIIEGTQGYGLGMHTRFYPQTTSSDCRAVDFLAMAGLSPWGLPIADSRGRDGAPDVWMVVRPFPIRVAGNSGPLHGETSWETLGLAPEYTTVTRKERRVGHWDARLVASAHRANGGDRVNVVLSMLDQVIPELTEHRQISLAGLPQDLAKQVVETLHDYGRSAGLEFAAYSCGPLTRHIHLVQEAL